MNVHVISSDARELLLADESTESMIVVGDTVRVVRPDSIHLNQRGKVHEVHINRENGRLWYLVMFENGDGMFAFARDELKKVASEAEKERELIRESDDLGELKEAKVVIASSGDGASSEAYARGQGKVNMNETTRGVKADAGKPRLELIPPEFLFELGKVLTMGAEKYDPLTDTGAVDQRVFNNNWRNGMRYGRVYGAMQRHLNAWFAGEDNDPESGLSHLAHAAFGLMALHTYMRTFPQGDDRPHAWRTTPRIGLDVDGVICDTYGYLTDILAVSPMPHYNWGEEVAKLFETFNEEDFMKMPPLIDGENMPFEPVVYVTARKGIGLDVLPRWLSENDFPEAPIVSAHGKDKVNVLKEHNVTLFVEDRFETFVDINNGGIACLLLDQVYNRKHDVGNFRIMSLFDITDRKMY